MSHLAKVTQSETRSTEHATAGFVKIHVLYAAVAGMAAGFLVWFFFIYPPVRQKIQNDRAGLIFVEEGIKLVEEIRKENRKKFPGKLACWNTKPEHADAATCDRSENKIRPGFYAISKDGSGGSMPITMVFVSASFDRQNPDEAYRLKNTGDVPMYREIQIERVEGLPGIGSDEIMEVRSSVFYEGSTQPQPMKLIILLTDVGL